MPTDGLECLRNGSLTEENLLGAYSGGLMYPRPATAIAVEQQVFGDEFNFLHYDREPADQHENEGLMASTTISFNTSGPSTDQKDGLSRRSGSTRMAAVNILKRWFDQHRDAPYPAKQDKAALSEQSGLSVAQVSTWFANTRRRRRFRPASYNPPLSPFPPQRPIDISRPTPKEASFMSPLERWRNSPPEAEAASFDAIMGAVAENNLRQQYLPLNSAELSTPSDVRSCASSNASGSAVTHTSASSVPSVGSHSSNGSFSQFYVADIPQRRRRRKRVAASNKPIQRPTPDQRPYQCTFCTDTFRTKYDWTRHEKTLHLSLESYTCCPGEPTYPDLDGLQRCVFCDQHNPSKGHVESHSYARCKEKPHVLRTFYRKDHLMQHLRLVHRVNQLSPGMETWKAQIDKIKSRCGLCNENFNSWSARNEHIAEHFRNGALMKDWRGSRGLDPAVALSTENAMPPYLIGWESLAPDPFSASLQTGSVLGFADSTMATMPIQTAKPSPFAYFTVQLSKFVRGTQTTSDVITDDMLQRAARRIVFGDEDPWNQTPADNSEWLTMFKQAMGLDCPDDTVANSPSLLCAHEINDFLPLFPAGPWAPWSMLNLDPDDTQDAEQMATYMDWSLKSPDDLAEIQQYCADDMYTELPTDTTNPSVQTSLPNSGWVAESLTVACSEQTASANVSPSVSPADIFFQNGFRDI
ncbi:hypothetical protein BDW69DRAFT_183425 [Aspergillus filifer]